MHALFFHDVSSRGQSIIWSGSSPVRHHSSISVRGDAVEQKGNKSIQFAANVKPSTLAGPVPAKVPELVLRVSLHQ